MPHLRCWRGRMSRSEDMSEDKDISEISLSAYILRNCYIFQNPIQQWSDFLIFLFRRKRNNSLLSAISRITFIRPRGL